MTPSSLNFKKLNGLIPAVIQHYQTSQVLMVGFMNEEAYTQTKETQKVTFYSRTKERLWTKGETSGNFLHVKNILVDCDQDTLLIKADPVGPTCHTGDYSCFQEAPADFDITFLQTLFDLIKTRKQDMPAGSYTTSLFEEGLDRITQKVGEEAIETVIASKNDDQPEFIGESSDLLYHLMVLLVEKNVDMSEIIGKLKERHTK
jgi:phosphoribosyl-ATP pyrophosphohydrolase/phosphoribosyl-AMP cyclohydrolase